MKKLIVITAMLIMLIASAFAYQSEWDINTNMNAGSRIYRCLNNICTENNVNIVDEDSGTAMELEFSGNGNPDRYALFIWPQDACAVPTAFHQDVSQSATFLSNVNFAKQDKDHCGSNVLNEWLSASNVAPGTQVSFTAWLEHAWWFPDQAVTFWPNDLESFWTSKVNVKFYVNDILTEEKQIEIPMETHWYQVGFDFTPTEPGTYVIRIETNMNDDCKCDGSNTKSVEATLEVANGEIPEFSLAAVIMAVSLAGLFVVARRK